jgi:hypothetical protein
VHIKLKNVSGNLFKLKNKIFEREQLLDEVILTKLMNQVSIAESNIIKCINYDFNIEMPNKILYEVWESSFRSDIDILNLTKILILDSFRAGVSLFYDAATITFACLIAANHLLNGTFLPSSKNFSQQQQSDDIYQQQSGMNLEESDELAAQQPTYKIDQLLPPSFMLNLKGFDEHSIKEQFGKNGAHGVHDGNGEKSNWTEKALQEWMDKAKPGIKLSDIWGKFTRSHLYDQRSNRLCPRRSNSLINQIITVNNA